MYFKESVFVTLPLAGLNMIIGGLSLVVGEHTVHSQDLRNEWVPIFYFGVGCFSSGILIPRFPPYASMISALFYILVIVFSFPPPAPVVPGIVVVESHDIPTGRRITPPEQDIEVEQGVSMSQHEPVIAAPLHNNDDEDGIEMV